MLRWGWRVQDRFPPTPGLGWLNSWALRVASLGFLAPWQPWDRLFTWQHWDPRASVPKDRRRKHPWPLEYIYPSSCTTKNISRLRNVPCGQNHSWLKTTDLGSIRSDFKPPSYPAVRKFYPSDDWSPFSVQVIPNWGKSVWCPKPSEERLLIYCPLRLLPVS